jgi:hypothetical protein
VGYGERAHRSAVLFLAGVSESVSLNVIRRSKAVKKVFEAIDGPWPQSHYDCPSLYQSLCRHDGGGLGLKHIASPSSILQIGRDSLLYSSGKK